MQRCNVMYRNRMSHRLRGLSFVSQCCRRRSANIDDCNHIAQGPAITHRHISDLIYWRLEIKGFSPFCLSPPLWPFSDAISLYKGFFPFLWDFASFSKEQRASSFYDNICILSPFFPIQIAVDSEWKDLFHGAISRNFLAISFSSMRNT